MTFVSRSTGKREGPLRDPQRLQSFLKFQRWPTAIATAEQVHKAVVRIVPKLSDRRTYPGADGLLTTVVNQPLGIFTADCVPIFVTDEKRGVVGLLHAGWRGVRGRILARAVALMRQRFGSRAKDIRFWTGPAIGPCCFEVQWDVARYFPRTRKRFDHRYRIDLAKEIHAQGRALGLRASLAGKSIAACTMHGRRHFSYRRDKATDRQISLISRTA